MRYAVISDIHANPLALRTVLADAQAQRVDSFICLGDIVGYGPLPRQAVQLTRQYCATTLQGNHDFAIGAQDATENFANLADESIQRHRAELAPEERDWLAQLPRTATFGSAAAAHADFTDDAQFYYVESADDAKANFNVRLEQLLFVGHTHTPALFVTGHSGAVYSLPPCDFSLEEGKRYLVNPGSVGYPREKDGKCHSSYVIYDSDTNDVFFRYLPFDVSGLLQRGGAHKNRRSLVWGLILGLILLLGTLATWLLTSSPAASPAFPEQPLMVRTLELLPTDRDVRANLKLEKDSSPAALEVRFLTADRQDAAPVQVIPVKKSSLRSFKIPKNAAIATFSVFNPSTGAAPRIKVFAPTRTPQVANTSTHAD